MYLGRKVAVVMPAHNEEQLIARAIEQVPSFVDHTIVIDDCSVDGTIDVVQEAASRQSSVRLIAHDQNKGAGAAIVTGYRASLQLGADIAVVMAGDAQMDPGDLPSLLAPVVDGEADFAKGDRLSWPGVAKVMPFWRWVGNHILSLLTRITSGYREVRDSQCGYTAVSADLLRRMPLHMLYPRYGYPNDFLAHLGALGARLSQVPVRPIYGEEVSGISWFTACFRVPWVLLRSHWRRHQIRRLVFQKS